LPFRAVCLTDNPQLRRTLRRSLSSAGSEVEFAASAQALADGLASSEPDLIVLDPQSRRALDLGHVTRAQVMVVGEAIDHEDSLALLRGRTLNHLFADPFSTGAVAEEEAFVVTSGKLFQRDIFGVEKYLAWGALVREHIVQSYEEKRQALLEVAAYAADVGARRQTVARIESVTDELLMNALYDAPSIRQGVARREAEIARAGAHADGEFPALLRYACDGRYFGVSVRDSYGELRKDDILDHVLRARAQRGTPQEKPSGGAGLGLYFVITSVTRFVANIAPGKTTEVIGLFDLKAAGRDADGCARSLHVFQTP
jgi:hypothetical protein